MSNIKYLVRNSQEIVEMEEIVKAFFGEDSGQIGTISNFGMGYQIELGTNGKELIRVHKEFEVITIDIEKENNGYRRVNITYRLPEVFSSKIVMVTFESFANSFSFKFL